MPKRFATRDDMLPDGLTAGGLAYEVVCAAGGDGQRQPPEWVQLTPRGRVRARDGRLFAFDPEKLAAAFAEGGLDLPVDFDHESEFTMMAGSKPARGWINAVEARPDGLFGRIDWLPAAVTALAERAYRYISPTFWREEDGVTARLLKGAALVSSPALGMPAVASASHEDHDMTLKELLALLGLAETASATDAAAAIATLKAGDPATFVPKAQHDATLAALASAEAKIKAGEDAAQAARCASLVDEAVKAGKLAPAARDQYLALASVAYDATKAAIEAMPVVLQPGSDKANDKANPATASGALSEAEQDTARRMGVSEKDWLAARAA